MTPADFETWLRDSNRTPILMGVLNVTPDSFSDGGAFLDPTAALVRARQMLAEGAAIIDVGGESTKPGSEGVSQQEQIRRVVPVIEALKPLNAVISIDTTLAAVAEAALEAGATMINDISAGRDDPAMLPLAAKRGVPIALMHVQGTPRDMQHAPSYRDVVAEVRAFLLDRAQVAADHGIAKHRIMLDVGIGFGKTIDHNLALLKHHAHFADAEYVMLLGTSRKGFIGKLTNVANAADRVIGTAATVAWGVANGAGVLRVHDVEAMRQVLAVVDAIRKA